MNRTPPHSVEAEMSVLGAMMLSQRSARECRASLSPEDFYRPSHRVLFKHFVRLVDKGSELDFVTVPEAMGKELDEIGGLEFLIQVASAPPSAHNAAHYAGILLDLSALRRLAEAAERAYNDVFDEDREPSEKVRDAQSAFGAIRSGIKPWTHIGDIAVAEKSPESLSTCWPRVDSMIGFGGLTKGEPHLIEADTGKGKSLLGAQLARHWAFEKGLTVAVVTLELTKEFFKLRMLFQDTGYWSASHADRYGEREAYERKAQSYALSDLYFFDYGGSPRLADRTCDAVLSDLRAFHAGVKLDAVIVDYVQAFSVTGKRNPFEVHAANAQELRWFAKQSGTCTVMLSQVKQKDGRMQTRGSQEYRDVASTALMLDRGKETGDRLVSSKARHGKESFVEVPLREDRLVFLERDAPNVYRGGD